MGLRRKLRILADAAEDDASCALGGAKGRDSRDGEGIGPVVATGICHRGCIHLKAMPEVSPDRIALAGRYADRLSRNVGEILVGGEDGMLGLSPDPTLAWVRKHRLDVPLRGAAPFLVTPDRRPGGLASRRLVARPRQPELPAHA